MTELARLEDRYGDFYVPAFKVTVGGEDVVRDLFLTVTAADVDLKEKMAGRFNFTVANAFDWERRAFISDAGGSEIDLIELFAFGASIELYFGYGDPTGLTSLLKGMVTEVSTSFKEGNSPELTVSGYDSLYPLVNGKSTRHWEDARDSDAVSDIVAITQMRTDIRSTDPLKRRIDQSQEADIAFLTKLAERNGATFYARDGAFYFGPRRNTESEAIKLAWGKGLLTFNPEAKLTQQLKTVEVHGWSESGEAVVGSATQGDETGRDTGRNSGAERVAAAVNTEPAMRVRASVHSQSEAQARARAILEERAQQFVSGDGDCIGLPDIVPDMNIALEDLGTTFSKTYYVTGARHTVDGNGYRTSFDVKETTL
ncbi:MAG: contractile injection system protein, VgrG/Pvc8 family [Pseudomonadota bacterium]